MSALDQPVAHEPDWLDYAEFGERFIRQAVTADAVASALSRLSGRGIRIGPLSSGPIGLAQFEVVGTLGTPSVRQVPDCDSNLQFHVSVPATLTVTARLIGQTQARADVQIALVLTARAAEPLLIVIDIAPVDSAAVQVRMKADGLAVAAVTVFEPFIPELRRQIARKVNATLDAPDTRAARIIDVAAKIERQPGAARRPRPAVEQVRRLDYGQFGARFVRAAVTHERVERALAALSGTPIVIAPMRTGPRGLAEVSASGTVGRIALSEGTGPLVGFDATVPIDLQLLVRLAGDKRYDCQIVVRLALQARAAEPLLLIVDVSHATAREVAVTVQPGSVAASVLRRLGGLDDQLRAQVAGAVNARMTDRAGRTFDIAERIRA